ncbi:ABC transporter ATP-binding protein [Amphibiibacter pelophylacis]|uniref:ABC transporter ATP-binding protein n=1 Tax=Amphibiibacter pelophylacis TaxID=1799477 RepID=A0ACC6NZZ9_9BURK
MGLNLESLTIRYGSAPPAVQGVSLALGAGRIAALIGPSGCGKTSLLRAVAGLVPVAEGRIRVAGTDVSGVAPEQRQVGMMFQDYALFPHLRVDQNIAFGLHRRTRAERERRVAQMLEMTGLADLAREPIHQLSGGQQQRVALARALAPQPRVMLLDEPFSALDVELRERLAHEVRQILRQSQTTTLLVTHDQSEAFALADEVGVMNAGRLEQWGEPQDLYLQPATPFAADFVGRGTLISPALGQALGFGPGVLPEIAAPDGGPPHWLLRPADLCIADEGIPPGSAARPVLSAELVRKSFRGADWLYTLRLTALPGPQGTAPEVRVQVPAWSRHDCGTALPLRPAFRPLHPAPGMDVPSA